MADLISKIQKRYYYAVCRCAEKGCTINLEGISNYTSLKGEKLTTDAICDCLIFDNRGGLTVSLIELKSRSLDVEHIKKKFENSTNETLNILEQIGVSKVPDFVFALLAKSYKNHSTFVMLKNIKIMLKNRKYPIRLKKCGDSLESL